ncbi:hypothetical protein QA599_02680 [Haloarculaceae archaeon H-GB1-1]|nr:hypothetical protein [Haloarculaceae archaeon H-GB1-1]
MLPRRWDELKMASSNRDTVVTRVPTSGRTALATARNYVFGDQLGVALFLGTLSVFVFTWRIGVFITDTHTLVHTLPAVANGHLSFGATGPNGLGTPGVHAVDGKLYGRNYGQLVATVPFYWAITALSTVVDLRIGILVGWSLLTIGFGHYLGEALGRRSVTLAGAVAGLTLFVVNLSLGPMPLSTDQIPVLSLQAATLLSTAMTSTLVYRLCSAMTTRTTGVVGGTLTVLATAVGFWAAIPKRHTFTTMLVMGIVFAFYRSRHPDSAPLSPLTYRAVAYALVGLTTWVHAAEGFILFAGLVVVDLATAEQRDARTLATIGGVFAVSLLPMLLTNFLIAGSPFQPPRLLPPYLGGEQTVSHSQGSSRTGIGGTSDESTITLPTSTAFKFLDIVLLDGIRLVLHDPGRLVPVYVRSGYISGIAGNDLKQALNLTVLESTPILGATISLIGGGIRRWGTRSQGLLSRLSPTDWLVGTYWVLFTTLYLPKLPLHAQLTVRYLLPVYALGVYVVLRQAAIRRTLTSHIRAFTWAYACTVLLGGQVLVVVLVVLRLSRGEAFQLHALLGLTAAAVLASSAVGASLDERLRAPTAIALGFAAGLGTSFVFLSALSYFQYGTYALPLARELASLLALG